MATIEPFSIIYDSGKDVYFRISDLSGVYVWDRGDEEWKEYDNIAPSNRKISTTENTDLGDSTQSVYFAVVDLSAMHTDSEPKSFLVQAVDDDTDEILVTKSYWFSDGKMLNKNLDVNSILSSIKGTSNKNLTDIYGEVEPDAITSEIVQITEDTTDTNGDSLGKTETGEGIGISGVYVVAYDEDDADMETPLYKTTTDGDGGFSLKVAKGATYKIAFVQSGYNSATALVEV